MKRILVTGGAKRVGRRLVERLASAGHGVVIHANTSAAEAEALAKTLRAKNPNVWTVTGSLAGADAADLIDRAAAAAGGPLTALVNNAAIFAYDAPNAIDHVAFDRAMAVNLRAPILLAERFAAQADANADNVIVNLLDQKLWNPNPDFYSYTLSKAALLTATDLMARCYAPNVRVNAIAPGLLLPSYDQTAADFAVSASVNAQQRPIEIDDLASALEFLLTNSSLTNQVIHVDNGQRLIASARDVMFLNREPGGGE